jgi:hypothetical protein
MLNRTGAQCFSEGYESERFPQLTKEQGGAADLRAPKILRFAPNPCNLTCNATAEGKELRRDRLREFRQIELKNDFSPKSDRCFDRPID